MNDKVNLLAYLNPAAVVAQPELVLHAMMSAVAPVTNLKLIANDPTVKAFVQVSSARAADRLIAQLSGKVLPEGKLKIVLSKHKDVVYPVSIAEMLKRSSVGTHDRTRTTGTDCSREDSLPEDDLKKVPSADAQIAFFKGKTEEGSEAGVEEHTIRITHSDMEALKGGRVLRIFRRFGRIVHLTFDYERAHWTIEYRSSKEVLKIATAIKNDTLYGYVLAEEPLALKCPQNEELHDFDATHLRLSFNDSYTTLEQVSLLLAATHMPAFVYQTIEARTSASVFIAQFKKSSQAAEVFQVLCNTERGRMTCSPLVLV